MNPDFFMLFIPTIAAVSLVPGMCMMLAFTLGMSLGYGRTLWMMAGELMGVATVVSASLWLLQRVLMLNPLWFRGLMLAGAVYLFWVAYQLWRTDPVLRETQSYRGISPWALLMLGFTTAVMNPKGWAFMFALLPGFIDAERPLGRQLALFLSVITVTEFLSMTLYALAGRWLRQRMENSFGLPLINKLAAVMMVAVSGFVLF